MSKPLELTIYPRPRMKAHYQGPAPYLDMGSGTLTSEHAANMLAGAKRLTEAELAAEYHQALGEANLLLMSPRRSGKTTAANIANTLHRFATHPHYFEATEPESDTE